MDAIYTENILKNASIHSCLKQRMSNL